MELEQIVDGAKVMPSEFAARIQSIVGQSKTDTFRLPVLGGMKAGKSTLLSRLFACESSFLPPGVLEATARSVRISYGFAASRKIVHADDSETLVDDDAEWDGLVRGKTTSLLSHDLLSVELPNDFLRDGGVVVYDTPGNNTVDGVKEDEMWSALSGSQLAIYCLRATAMLTKSDLQFLKTALPQIRNFIFVVTRIDEAGISDANSLQAKELVDYVASRLAEEFPVQPVATVAVSSSLEGEDSGIPALSRLILSTLKSKGDALRESIVRLEIKSLAQNALPTVKNEIALIEKALQDGSEKIAERIGAFKSQLVETESEKNVAIRRLNTELASKKLGVKQEVAACGRSAVERVKSRIEAFKSSSEMESCSKGILLSEADRWREDVKAVVARMATAGDEALSAAASEFLTRIEGDAKRELNVDFQIVLADIDRYEVSSSLTHELEGLSRQGIDVQNEIASLEKEMQGDLSQLPELQQNLAAIKQQLSEIGEYKPQYIERQYGVGEDGAEGTLRKIGEIADWVLLFTPIPMSKLKWLSKLKYGKQICGMVKKANKVIRAKNTLFKNVGKTIPGLSRICDVFSVEHWAGKLGQLIDQGSAQTVMEEDLDFKRAYDEKVAPYLAAEQDTTARLQMLHQALNDKKQLLDLEKSRNDHVTSEIERLEREIAEQNRSLAAEKESERLSVGKRQLLERAMQLFQNSRSEFTTPVFEEIDRVFSESVKNLVEKLIQRMDATLSELRGKLDHVQQQWQSDSISMENNLSDLHARRNYLEKLLTDSKL